MRAANAILAAMMRERAGKFHPWLLRSLVCAAAALNGACTTMTAPDRATRSPAESQGVPATPTRPAAPRAATPSAPAAELTQVEWAALPGWRDDDLAEAWPALLASCSALARDVHWTDVCAAATHAAVGDAGTARQFFEQHFRPYRMASAESGDEGLITGYYEPLLFGSRMPTERYRHPLYAVPDDLLVVDLAALYPDLENMRLRGRVSGRRLVPYLDRAAIDGPEAPLRGKEIAWVDDPYDLFFLHIQGSGRISMENGETMRVGYAEQNGHPYKAIGRVLIERGDLTREEVSLQTIRSWLRAHPDQAIELLNTNPSYVFFRELSASAGGPPGSLGVPLTPRRSIAVDRRYVPLGTPVYVASSSPDGSRALNRLVLAQDTGGAIRGPVRADFFWGAGEKAEREAGGMRDRLRMWILLPQGHPLPASN